MGNLIKSAIIVSLFSTIPLSVTAGQVSCPAHWPDQSSAARLLRGELIEADLSSPLTERADYGHFRGKAYELVWDLTNRQARIDAGQLRCTYENGRQLLQRVDGLLRLCQDATTGRPERGGRWSHSFSCVGANDHPLTVGEPVLTERVDLDTTLDGVGLRWPRQRAAAALAAAGWVVEDAGEAVTGHRDDAVVRLTLGVSGLTTGIMKILPPEVRPSRSLRGLMLRYGEETAILDESSEVAHLIWDHHAGALLRWTSDRQSTVIELLDAAAGFTPATPVENGAEQRVSCPARSARLSAGEVWQGGLPWIDWSPRQRDGSRTGAVTAPADIVSMRCHYADGAQLTLRLPGKVTSCEDKPGPDFGCLSLASSTPVAPIMAERLTRRSELAGVSLGEPVAVAVAKLRQRGLLPNDPQKTLLDGKPTWEIKAEDGVSTLLLRTCS